jgi:hypothetical protein
VLECLQRSLKIADVCMTSSMHVHLFVEILNQYLYYFENDCPLVRTSLVLCDMAMTAHLCVCNPRATREPSTCLD